MTASVDERSGEQVGVLGGTFDPIHLGHLAVADHASTKLALDRVIFIPAARPPHKPDIEITPFIHRAAMLELAVEDRPEFVVSTMEVKRVGPSYSIDTLKELRSRLNRIGTIFFLIGMDAFIEIDTWKYFRFLPEVCDIVVINRSDYSLDMMAKISSKFGSYAFSDEENCWMCPGISGRIHSLIMDPVDISSTRIREMRGKGASIDSLVPVPVADYIELKGLFT